MLERADEPRTRMDSCRSVRNHDPMEHFKFGCYVSLTAFCYSVLGLLLAGAKLVRGISQTVPSSIDRRRYCYRGARAGS